MLQEELKKKQTNKQHTPHQPPQNTTLQSPRDILQTILENHHAFQEFSELFHLNVRGVLQVLPKSHTHLTDNNITES